jgi:hypothetical protein
MEGWKALVSEIPTVISPEVDRAGSIFRFLVKEPNNDPTPLINTARNIDIRYKWNRLGFFTSWAPSNTVLVLCFDLPLVLKDSLQTCLLNSESRLQIDDPFWFHALLIEELAVMYDKALWSWRHLIRDIEKVWITVEKQTALTYPASYMAKEPAARL